MIWLLDSIVGHVHIAVFENKSALRIEEILDAQATLRVELSVAGEFRRVVSQGCVENTRAKIKKRDDVMLGLPVQTKKQSVPDQMTARMD